MSTIFHVHPTGSLLLFVFTRLEKVFHADVPPRINIWNIQTMRASGYSDNKTPVSEIQSRRCQLELAAL